MRTYSKIELARIQLERAISLFVEQKDYVSAITLAGAAEEILGVIVKESGGESAYHSEQSAFNYMYRHFFREEPPDGHFRELAVGARNHLKHYSATEQVTINARKEAANLIDRGIDNFWKVAGEETEAMRTFRSLGEPLEMPFNKA